MTTSDVCNEEREEWRMFIDGAAGKNGSGVGIILRGPQRIRIEYAVRMGYEATNNAAEYEALIMGLRLANEVKVENLTIFCDSQLVVNQIKGNFITKDSNMSRYLERAQELILRLENLGGQWKIVQIPREENEADSLAKSATENGAAFQNMKFKEILISPTIKSNEVLIIDKTEDWTKPIIEYLDSGTLPENNKEARKIRIKAAQYSL